MFPIDISIAPEIEIQIKQFQNKFINQKQKQITVIGITDGPWIPESDLGIQDSKVTNLQ